MYGTLGMHHHHSFHSYIVFKWVYGSFQSVCCRVVRSIFLHIFVFIFSACACCVCVWPIDDSKDGQNSMKILSISKPFCRTNDLFNDSTRIYALYNRITSAKNLAQIIFIEWWIIDRITRSIWNKNKNKIKNNNEESGRGCQLYHHFINHTNVAAIYSWQIWSIFANTIANGHKHIKASNKRFERLTETLLLLVEILNVAMAWSKW